MFNPYIAYSSLRDLKTIFLLKYRRTYTYTNEQKKTYNI